MLLLLTILTAQADVYLATKSEIKFEDVTYSKMSNQLRLGAQFKLDSDLQFYGGMGPGISESLSFFGFETGFSFPLSEGFTLKTKWEGAIAERVDHKIEIRAKCIL